MSGTEQVMAILLEAEDIQVVHKDWPMNMRLSMCLMPSGDCQILLFREEEADRFPERLRKHLGLRAEELSIHPQTEGYPTCSVSYSDERNLGALLADAPNLLEDASDYSVNYSYALEEGLDPVAFLGTEPSTPVADAAPVADVQDGAPEGAIAFQSSRAKPEPKPAEKPLRNLTFDLQREAERLAEKRMVADPAPSIAPGQGFLRADHLNSFETPPGEYVLSYQDGWFDLIRDEGDAMIVTDATHLFMRDDHQLLAIRRLDDSLPKHIRLKAALMPEVMKASLHAALGKVQIAAEDGFIFVTLPKPTQEAPQSVETLAQPKKRSLWAGVARNRGLRLLALTSATTIAILLIMTADPSEAVNGPQERAIDWSQFRLSQAEQ